MFRLVQMLQELIMFGMTHINQKFKHFQLLLKVRAPLDIKSGPKF